MNTEKRIIPIFGKNYNATIVIPENEEYNAYLSAITKMDTDEKLRAWRVKYFDMWIELDGRDKATIPDAKKSGIMFAIYENIGVSEKN